MAVPSLSQLKNKGGDNREQLVTVRKLKSRMLLATQKAKCTLSNKAKRETRSNAEWRWKPAKCALSRVSSVWRNRICLCKAKQNSDPQLCHSRHVWLRLSIASTALSSKFPVPGSRSRRRGVEEQLVQVLRSHPKSRISEKLRGCSKAYPNYTPSSSGS